jgi:hypothetical protein
MYRILKLLVGGITKFLQLLHAQLMVADTTHGRRRCTQTLETGHDGRFPEDDRKTFPPPTAYDIFVVLSIPPNNIFVAFAPLLPAPFFPIFSHGRT